jgi:CelD/BcsL family acetyltransferase involved in cellulose biosynthesis
MATDFEGVFGVTSDEWLSLWERDPEATPFQHPAWLTAWWRILGGGEGLAASVRIGGRLVAFLPLFLYRGRGRRTLMPLGISHSDYLGPLVDPNHCREARSGLRAALGRLAHRADSIELPDLRCAWWGPRDLREGALNVEAGAICPVLELAPGRDLGALIPAAMMKRVIDARKRAGRLGQARWECATAETAMRHFDLLCDLHRRRWAERGEGGALGDPHVKRFHREAAPALARAGLLRLYVLRMEGAPVAVHYGFVDRFRAHFYLGGFDPDYRGQSFGTIAIAHAIEEAAREGLQEFHFLRGGEAYKYQWGAQDRQSHVARIPAPEAAALARA